MDKLFYAVIMVLLVASAHASEEFLISQWVGPSKLTQEKIAEAAGANFNVLMAYCRSAEDLKLALDLYRTNGVKALITGPVISNALDDTDHPERLDSVIADCANHPALWGYYVWDEPNSSYFKRLATANRYLLKKDPRCIPYINLLPTYASLEQLGAPTYEQYVDEYLRVVRPKLLSYDNYTLLEGSERPDYFENMEIIRRQSIKHGVPFVFVLLSTPHDPYRDPSESDLRWQVNTALAYGAHGVMYFTYETPTPSTDNCRNGIINADGTRGRKYEEVKRINAELLKLGPLFMRLKSVAVYHTAPVPTGAKALPGDGLIRAVDGGEFVIGQFSSDDGAIYAMFVNRSLKSAAHPKIVFSKKVQLYEVSRTTGREQAAMTSQSGNLTIWSPKFVPGQGRLVRIDPVQSLPVIGWEDLPRFRPRVMINPSAQFCNVVTDENGAQLYREADTMYDFAVEVADELRKDGRIDAFVSRDSRDREVTLSYETELTRSLNCDAFVALHSDATGKEGEPGGGTWSFYADDEGKRLAECVQAPLLDAIRSFYPDVVFRGIRTHWRRLWVLHENYCPAMLVEIMFHSDPVEREMLKAPALRAVMTKAIARGILNYFGLNGDAA